MAKPEQQKAPLPGRVGLSPPCVGPPHECLQIGTLQGNTCHLLANNEVGQVGLILYLLLLAPPHLSKRAHKVFVELALLGGTDMPSLCPQNDGSRGAGWKWSWVCLRMCSLQMRLRAVFWPRTWGRRGPWPQQPKIKSKPLFFKGLVGPQLIGKTISSQHSQWAVSCLSLSCMDCSLLSYICPNLWILLTLVESIIDLLLQKKFLRSELLFLLH